jgi:hypothetical protein
MENRSHMTEVQQKTRMELENGDVSEEEMEEAIRVRTPKKMDYGRFSRKIRFSLLLLHRNIQAFRFHPTRVECMSGGPDSILWNRWEWSRDQDGIWKSPVALLPH